MSSIPADHEWMMAGCLRDFIVESHESGESNWVTYIEARE